MRLHSKLILVLVPLIAAPLVALGWFSYTQQRERVEVESARQLRTIVDQVDREVRARLEAARADAVLFASSHLLRRYMLVEDEAQRFRLLQPGLLRLFASYQRANPEYYEIRVLLPDGYEDTRAATTPGFVDSDEGPLREFERAAFDAPEDLLTQIVIDSNTEHPAAVISHRLAFIDPSVDPILAKPKLRGYLFITMSLDFLREQTDAVHVGERGHVFFSDERGRILFAPSQIDHPHEMPRSSVEAVLSGVRSDALVRASHLGEATLMFGRQVYENLYAFIALPESELLASTGRLAYVTLGLIIATIVLTSTLLFGVLRSLLLQPLVRLGEAARAVGRGNPVTDLGIRRRDEIGHLAASFEDMTKSLQESHEQIAHLAHHDSLTGLPNRRLFTQVLERALEHARREHEGLALLFLDLDDFKRVNDSLGHQAGDTLLCEVAERLTSVVRPGDQVAWRESSVAKTSVSRLGGDEFIVLLSALDEPMDAAAVARRILDVLARPIVIGGAELDVNASIGITVFPQDGALAADLIKNADIAMYHAKDQGKNHFQFFTSSLNAAVLRRVELERALRKALGRDELVLHYQPQVDASSRAIVGVEALVRWQNPELGLVPPGDFIPLAEETGLIVQIGEWVLREACRQNKAWQDAGLAPVPIAVNISAKQFTGTKLDHVVARALDETGLPAPYLELELTETSVMSHPEEAVRTLAALKALGIQISLDDFGTGYSSLGLLKRLPIDVLKIDRSFVDEVTSDDNDAAITAAIIAMARSLHLGVIAEGVERLDQLAFLREHGCDRIQGYLISRPVPAEELVVMLARPREVLPVCGPLAPVREPATPAPAPEPLRRRASGDAGI